MVDIIKASGNKAIFKKNRIEKSVLQAGASKEFARKVAEEVSSKVAEGMPTNKILDLTLRSLKKHPEIAARYDLKRAIMMLGPSGYAFEEYFAQILQNYGYKTQVGIKMKGEAISQEVDVLATKDDFSYMIEAKYHNKKGIHTNTKVAMYTYARFLDVKKKNKVDGQWLVTNTRCTHNAVKYAKGVNLKIIGWAYPREAPLQKLIEDKALYPITIFKGLSNSVKEKLFGSKIVLAKDLARHGLKELSRKTGLRENELQNILVVAKKICGEKMTQKH